MRLVEADVGDAGRHELVERDRVREALRHGLGDRSAHEHLLPRDAPEVGGGIGLPLAILVQVLEVAGANELPRLLAVEHLALGCRHVQTGVAVANGSVEPHRHAADGIDELLEALEVDLDVVVDRDVEVVLDGVDQRLHAVRMGGVDALRLAGAGDRDVQVAREGEHVGLLLLRVDPQHHDRVGALASGVAQEVPGVGVGRVDALAAVRAHQQEVGRFTRLGPLEVDVGHTVDLPVPDPEVPRHARGADAGHHDHAADDDHDPLSPGAVPRAGRGGGRHGPSTLSAPSRSPTAPLPDWSDAPPRWRRSRSHRTGVVGGRSACWRCSRPGRRPLGAPNVFSSSFVAGLAQRYPGIKVTAAVYDTQTGCWLHLHQGMQITTASVIKAQVLGAVLLKAQDAGRGLTAWERSQIGPMIRLSYNPETSALYGHVGSAAGDARDRPPLRCRRDLAHGGLRPHPQHGGRPDQGRPAAPQRRRRPPAGGSGRGVELHDERPPPPALGDHRRRAERLDGGAEERLLPVDRAGVAGGVERVRAQARR